MNRTSLLKTAAYTLFSLMILLSGCAQTAMMHDDGGMTEPMMKEETMEMKGSTDTMNEEPMMDTMEKKDTMGTMDTKEKKTMMDEKEDTMMK